MTLTIRVERAILSSPSGRSCDAQSWDVTDDVRSCDEHDAMRPFFLSSTVPLASHFPSHVVGTLEHNSFLEVTWTVYEERTIHMTDPSTHEEYVAYTRVSEDVVIDLPNIFSYVIERACYDVVDVRCRYPTSCMGVPCDVCPHGLSHFDLPLSEDVMRRIAVHTGRANEDIEKVSLSLRRSATYRTRVFTTSTHLKKDAVIGVELPLARLHCMFHYYTPLVNHPVLDIHHMYMGIMMRVCRGHVLVTISSSSDNEAIVHETNVRRLYTEARSKEALGDMGGMLKVLHVHNDRSKGEGAGFKAMIETMRKMTSTVSSGYVFYGHTKGTSKMPFDITLPPIALWSEQMYVYNVANIDVMIFHDAQFGGCFLKTGQYEGLEDVTWHYSGSMYWMNHRMLHQTQQHGMSETYFASEGFPGRVWPSPERCLCFLEHHEGTLYALDYHKAHSLSFGRDTARGYWSKMFYDTMACETHSWF